MLNNILKVCSEKTVVHINVPNARSFHRILAKNMNIIKDVYEKSERNITLQQNTIFDMESLQKLLAENQFKIISQGSYFIKPFSHKQMLELINNKIIDEKVLDGLYSMVSDMPMLGSEIYMNCRSARKGKG